VTAQIVGGRQPVIEHFEMEDAQWVFGSPDCEHESEIEIQTTGYRQEPGGLTLVSTDELYFSIAVFSS
jgi:hypothetical protein